MTDEKLFNMPFSKIYPMYIQKVERKGHTKTEVDQVIEWLLGYNQKTLQEKITTNENIKDFVDQAPKLNPNASLITGVICGVRVEEIDEPTMQKIRYLDKLVDEVAKGKAMDKILRQTKS